MLLILLMSKGSKVVFVAYIHNIDTFNAMYVEGVESYFDFRPLRHALIYIALDGMVGKVSVPAFQNFLGIENRLNIKKVMSKNVYVPCFNIT